MTTIRPAPVLGRAMHVAMWHSVASGGPHSHRATPRRRGILAVGAVLCALALPGGARAAPAVSRTTAALQPSVRVGRAATRPAPRPDALGGTKNVYGHASCFVCREQPDAAPAVAGSRPR
jgi:hypothetical protein